MFNARRALKSAGYFKCQSMNHGKAPLAFVLLLVMSHYSKWAALKSKVNVAVDAERRYIRDRIMVLFVMTVNFGLTIAGYYFVPWISIQKTHRGEHFTKNASQIVEEYKLYSFPYDADRLVKFYLREWMVDDTTGAFVEQGCKLI